MLPAPTSESLLRGLLYTCTPVAIWKPDSGVPELLKSRILSVVVVALAAVLTAGCAGNETERDPRASGAELYEKAQRDLRIGNYDKAIFNLEEVQARYPFSEFARQAQLDLIYAYYKNQEPESAVGTADQFIRENPRHPRVDYAYYLKGLVYYERQRNWLEALFRVDLSKRSPDDARRSFNNFALLLDRFPDSPYAEDARQRMVFLRNRLADYEVHVARFYIQRHAWLSAARRAAYVVENYPGAPQNKAALEILIQAYNKLEMADMADDARRVLAENYPQG